MAALLGLVLALVSLQQCAAVPSIRMPKHLSLDTFKKPWYACLQIPMQRR